MGVVVCEVANHIRLTQESLVLLFKLLFFTIKMTFSLSGWNKYRNTGQNIHMRKNSGVCQIEFDLFCYLVPGNKTILHSLLACCSMPFLLKLQTTACHQRPPGYTLMISFSQVPNGNHKSGFWCFAFFTFITRLTCFDDFQIVQTFSNSAVTKTFWVAQKERVEGFKLVSQRKQELRMVTLPNF